MKALKVLISVLILLAILCGGAYYYEIYVKKINIENTVEFKKGERVTSFLNKVGVKRNIFHKIYFRKTGVTSKIKAGRYKLEKNYTIAELFQILDEGRFEIVKLTIPEGFTVEQVEDLLIEKKVMTKEQFDNTLKSVNFPYITPNNNFEGYFYPETYYFAEGSSPKIVINTILKEFLKKYPIEKYGKNEDAKKDFYKKLVLASVVEREAVLDKEKPIIASVFYNRLKRGMRLESDATVNYVFGYKKRRIYYKDLKVDSPYNTYRNHGLPPAPIGNPGELAINASINPAKTNYYFFVATYDGTNSHHFTRTYKEHVRYQNKNKNKPK